MSHRSHAGRLSAFPAPVRRVPHRFGLLVAVSIGVSSGLSGHAEAQTVTAPATNATCVENAGLGQFACGTNSLANGPFNNTAVGNGAEATFHGSTAFGETAIAHGDFATAVGTNVQATADHATVFGDNSFVTGAFATGLGPDVTAPGKNSVAVGIDAKTGTFGLGFDEAIAIGDTASAFGKGAVVIGGVSNGALKNVGGFLVPGAAASGDFATVIGSGAYGSGLNSTAIGVNSVSSGTSSVALGDSAQATQTGSIAVGLNSAATGVNSIAIGNGARATGSVAVGAGAFASNGGAAYGDGASATGSLSAAIGPNAVATAPNSVALGSGSSATEANTVSVGAPGNERRITNVAAGINPTDAVNVSQLNSIATGLQGQISSNLIETRRGIAAAVATASAPMPSLPGKTTWQLRGSAYESQMGFGFGFAHRLNTSMPLAIIGGYGNGGGTQHTGYVGLGGEF